MITLFTIFFLFGLFSIYKIYMICKNKNVPFNPLEAPLIYHLGMLFAIATTISCFMVFCITFLP